MNSKWGEDVDNLSVCRQPFFSFKQAQLEQEEGPPHKPGREATVGEYLLANVSISINLLWGISISISKSNCEAERTFWRHLQARLGWGLQAGGIPPSLQKPQSSRCLRIQVDLLILINVSRCWVSDNIFDRMKAGMDCQVGVIIMSRYMLSVYIVYVAGYN